MGESANTWLKVTLSTGELSNAGTQFAIKSIPIEKKEAKIPVEDIVEELFGEIEDEHDTIAHIEKQLDENSYLFSARLEVDYLNEKYQLDLPESEFYETLGGMIAYTTGEIPAKGERIDVSSFSMKIEKVSATKIEQIILTKTEVN